MGDKESSSILKRKTSEPKVTSYHRHDDHHQVKCCPESSKNDKEEETEDQGQGAGPRRQSVTFISSSNDPCLDRRKLQRTPTPFHEILLAEADKSTEAQADTSADSENVSFTIAEPTAAVVTTSVAGDS